MEKHNIHQTDEQLAQELRKSRSGKLGGKLLSLVGVVIAVAGIVLGGNIVAIVIGGVLLALGQMVQGKSKTKASQQAFAAIAPGVIASVFENVLMDPSPPAARGGHKHSPAQPQPLQRQRIHPGNVSGSDYRSMYRPADGGKRGAAGGDRPVGEKTSRRSIPVNGCCVSWAGNFPPG